MKERLSALMDDQGDHAECEHCLGQVRADVELRETWQVYHLIGDVLRGTHGGTLPATFAQRMVDEPHGELWISTLIVYLLEALLCAPAYGGNPEAIGWHWLGHQPGFPLPDPDHIYPKLPL